MPTTASRSTPRVGEAGARSRPQGVGGAPPWRPSIASRWSTYPRSLAPRGSCGWPALRDSGAPGKALPKSVQGRPWVSRRRLIIVGSLRSQHRLGRADEEPVGGAGPWSVTSGCVALLAWVGCGSDWHELATWFGDDLAWRAASYEIDPIEGGAVAFLADRAAIVNPPLASMEPGTPPD
jgi:hypothetical protein